MRIFRSNKDGETNRDGDLFMNKPLVVHVKFDDLKIKNKLLNF